MHFKIYNLIILQLFKNIFFIYFTLLIYTKHLKQGSTKKYWTQQDYISVDEMSYSIPRKRDDIKTGGYTMHNIIFLLKIFFFIGK